MATRMSSTHVSDTPKKQYPVPVPMSSKSAFALQQTTAIVMGVTLIAKLAMWAAFFYQHHGLLIAGAYIGVGWALGWLNTDIQTAMFHIFGDNNLLKAYPIVKAYNNFYVRHHNPRMRYEITSNPAFTNTTWVALMLMTPLWLVAILVDPQTSAYPFIASFTCWACLGIVLTSDSHRLAHMMEQYPSRSEWSMGGLTYDLVSLLQSCYILLPTEHHRRHHDEEPTVNVSIFCGWVDTIKPVRDYIIEPTLQRPKVIMFSFLALITAATLISTIFVGSGFSRLDVTSSTKALDFATLLFQSAIWGGPASVLLTSAINPSGAKGAELAGKH